LPDDAYTDDRGMVLCEGCVQYYHRCPSCENFVSDNDGLYCSDCEEDAEATIKPYRYKPNPQFHRANGDVAGASLYFGIELEVSNANGTSDDVQEILGDDFYLKKDSSLTCGYEIVSHPRTLASWDHVRGEITEALDYLKSRQVDGDSDGLHVHVSRKAMTLPHQLRFSLFINQNQLPVSRIARRVSGYAAFEAFCRVPEYMPDKQSNRYRAVNWQNSSTVELRIFRTTLNVGELYTAIQFSHAVYQYTKIALRNELSWNSFIAYVSARKEKYSDLYQSLQKITEDLACAS
jgi:hypothetical protein